MNFKLGRNRPVARGPRLSLGRYLTADLPPPPDRIGWAPKAVACMARVFGNDTLADCTAAAAAHIVGVMAANANVDLDIPDSEVIAFYSATTGYVPGDPATDQGGDELTVLNYWQQHGFGSDGSHKISGYAAVDGADKMQVMTALFLFENVYFGVELPDAWVDPMPARDWFKWDVAGEPNRNNGHAFIGTGYTPDGVLIDTWGMRGLMTWEAVAKYASSVGSGELYTVFSRDALRVATGKAPTGFDETQLAADLHAIGHA